MSVTVQPAYRWSAGPQDLIAGLRLAAIPIATVDPQSIGARELIVADLQAIAVTARVAPHQSYTRATALVLAADEDALIVLATVAGATVGQFVACNQPVLEAFIYGNVTAADTVALRARNLAVSSQTVLAGTVIKYMLL